MPVLNSNVRHNLTDSAYAMQLHIEGVFKILKKGGPTQEKEIEISLLLMQKCLDSMRDKINISKSTEIENSNP